ncbi:alpha/beta-hydrolase [Mollisia scopiformis]|uniref:Alpha/beta-hydrolase n=1 Tax=Mollisia scopiformis TaxID=149040 RepID=A0A132BAX0_MOLSC|nr:alpha/beta-hydrolase [Mollisia scopiformis]KUJ09565.1 alpha/beta-hydrolase [Mollisia scopiformis]
MSQITPYKINVDEKCLAKLKQKLELVDFPEELEGAGWTYGASLSEIKSLTKYWLETFSWRTTEAKLNELSHFITPITVQGFKPVDIHFVHQKSEDPNAIPLLFVHGWPGSFIEVTKMLPLLKKGEGEGKRAFHVVAPSMANYGFSGRVTEKGWGIGQHAEALHKLMLNLGYDRYVTQGGDWGAFVTRTIGLKYPDHCKANHINMISAAEPVWTAENPKPEYSEDEKEGMATQQAFRAEGSGYLAIQGSKPATLAFSLQDSPVGLLAWIYEKLHTWTDSYPWTPEQILTWISIYYFSTAGPYAGIYTYYEAMHDPVLNFSAFQQYIDLPLGVAAFPKEMINSPESWWGTMGPIVHRKRFEKGGHFAAWERPEDLVGCLWEMFGEEGPVGKI